MSGGERLLQPDFCAALWQKLTSVVSTPSTAGNVPWEFMAKVLPHVDIVQHDHKLIDPDAIGNGLRPTSG